MQDVDLLFDTEMALFIYLFIFLFSESGFILIICTVRFREKKQHSAKENTTIIWYDRCVQFYHSAAYHSFILSDSIYYI